MFDHCILISSEFCSPRSALAPILATLRNGAVLPLEGHISAATAKDQIQRHVDAHGMPKFLALVGGPQAIPLHCETGTLFNEEKCRDAPYGDLESECVFLVCVCVFGFKSFRPSSILPSAFGGLSHIHFHYVLGVFFHRRIR